MGKKQDVCPGCNTVVYPPLGHKWSEHGPHCYTCLAKRLSKAERDRDHYRRLRDEKERDLSDLRMFSLRLLPFPEEVRGE